MKQYKRIISKEWSDYMNEYKNYTKDYLFALLISGDNNEKEYALQELCNRYKEICYYSIKRLAKEHIKE